MWSAELDDLQSGTGGCEFAAEVACSGCGLQTCQVLSGHASGASGCGEDVVAAAVERWNSAMSRIRAALAA